MVLRAVALVPVLLTGCTLLPPDHAGTRMLGQSIRRVLRHTTAPGATLRSAARDLSGVRLELVERTAGVALTLRRLGGQPRELLVGLVDDVARAPRRVGSHLDTAAPFRSLHGTAAGLVAAATPGSLGRRAAASRRAVTRALTSAPLRVERPADASDPDLTTEVRPTGRSPTLLERLLGRLPF